MFKTDILFTGYYGQKNTGDDAFIEVASWGANKYWNKTNVRFLAIQNKLPQTKVSAKGYPLILPKSYGFQKKVLINQTDYLISAGGSTIHSKLSPQNIKQVAVDMKNSGKKIKLGAIGVSVGPFKSIEDEKAVQQYLKSLDFIALRDQRSFDYVNQLNTPYQPVNAFDLAALMPKMYHYTKEAKLANGHRKTIGVSICPVESIQKNGDVNNENRRNAQLVELIKELDKNDQVEFKFFIINGHPTIGDKTLTQQLIQKANPKSYSIVDYSKNTEAIWREINNCDAVISTRLHGAIFACFGKTPFMLIEYHQKCSDFLEDVGYDTTARIYDADFDPVQKATQILEWCNNHTFEFPTNLSDKIDQARLNFTQITLA